ncbi:uncharacterized protein LOC142598183 [Dermatophagoides farinae]|uniref:uncharacterized protein LOC142598183 n=1 Tax=Dermatophagoides farinae TaxID=6954 RepID=UPI003F6487D6
MADENGEPQMDDEQLQEQQQQEQQQEQQTPESTTTGKIGKKRKRSKEKRKHQKEKEKEKSKKHKSSKIQVTISRIPTTDVTPILSCKSDGSDTEKIIERIGYRLEKQIGKGGFGTVYKAIDLKTKQKVACKVMTVSTNRKDQLLIKKELFILHSVEHKHIIRVYKHFILQSSKSAHVYIFMQFADKSDLWNLVRKKLETGMKEKQARKMFKQITSAIEYLHRRNIAHRDIKLENILLDKKYNCLVTDFGLSIVVIQKEGRVVNAPNYCGTIPYMAPEIHLFLITKIIFDVLQADVWALGVVLYCMINQGQFPFSMDQDVMLQQQLSGQFQFTDKMSFKPDDRLIDLMTQIFQPNPLIRIRMVDLVQHPWLIDAPMDKNIPKLKTCEPKIMIDPPKQQQQQQQQQQTAPEHQSPPSLQGQQQNSQQKQKLDNITGQIVKQNLKTIMMMMMNVGDKKGGGGGKQILEQQISPAMMMRMPIKKRMKMKKRMKVKVKLKKFQRSPMMMKMKHQPKSPFQQKQQQQQPPYMMPMLMKGKSMYPPMFMDKQQQQQQQFPPFYQQQPFPPFYQQQQQQQQQLSSYSSGSSATSTMSSDTSDSD